jgi:hypothetical protein
VNPAGGETARALGGVAEQLGPLLNRVVFFGIVTCRDQFEGPARVRAPVANHADFHAISTTSLDRIGGELMAGGWTRSSRQKETERWTSPSGIAITIETPASHASDSPDAAMLEYASLMTRSVPIGSGSAVRVSAAAAQLPLLWRLHARTGLAFSASPWVEDIIEIIVRKSTILAEVSALPEELRSMVAHSARAFSSCEAALWTIDRALPDARTTPGVAARGLERFRAIAALDSRG